MESISIEPEPYANLISILLFQLKHELDLNLVLLLLLITILIIFSGIISGSEVAFFSLKEKDLSKLEKTKHLHDQTIISLLNKGRKLLATILIANNLVNISIIILFTITFNSYIDFEENKLLSFLLQIVVITFILVVFGELVPKVYANQDSLRFSRNLAIPMSVLVRVFSPLSVMMVKGTKIIEKRIRRKNMNISAEEMKQAIDITSHKDQSPEDKRILKRIVNFGNVYVNQIMTSRMDVVAFEDNISFEEIIAEVNSNRFSRVPVFHESPDHIVGLLYIKDLLQHLGKDKGFEWQKLLRQPYFVPETKKIDDLLREFQAKKVHMAIVVDEYGGFSGIVTLEDVLEEIVGEITDEFDEAEESFFTKISENSFLFKGRTPLNDMIKVLTLPDDKFDVFTGEVETLGGLMTELLGKIPLKGEKTNYQGLHFVIESADKKKVKEVRVTLL